MPLPNFLKIVIKGLKFTISRPLQRFNIENRAVKYLGPESKKWTPSPRAIGPISGLSLKELPRYDHLSPGYKSIAQKRRTAIESKKLTDVDHVPKLKSYSEDEKDDNLVIKASNELDVIKTITRIEPAPKQIEPGEKSDGTPGDSQAKSSHRPLPKATDLPLQDLASIWEVQRTPPGRLNLNMLQEIMINKLADDKFWTPKVIADRYNIREEYAEKLIGHMKQIRICVSPLMAKNLDLAGLHDPQYNAAKHLIYHVDKSIRSERDRKYDSMFLPTDDLPDSVREVLDPPATQLTVEEGKSIQEAKRKRLERPQPLRIAPINEAPRIEDGGRTKAVTKSNKPHPR